jgi:DNA-binding LacI/PurR family transcriptional regulator
MRRHIKRGQWEQGGELPSVRQLARDWGVSSNTITAAQSLLEQDGTLRRVSRKGVFVRDRDELRKKPVMLIGHMQSNKDGENWSQRVTMGTLEELNRRQLQFHWPQWEKPTRGDVWAKVRQMIIDRKDDISGAIIAWALCSEEQMKELVDLIDMPIVKVGRHSRKCIHNYVSIDHFDAGHMVAEHVEKLIGDRVLLASGHPPHDFPRRQLIEGFMDGLMENREQLVHCDVMQLPMVDQATCLALLGDYLEYHPMPQVIYTTGDLLAIHMIKALQQLGHTIPTDVNIVSSTGLELAQVCHPTLAHVRQPMEDLGSHAVALLDQLIDLPGHWAAGIELPVTWQPGQSIAAL